nr:uncharacterized protein LOC100187023 [Ciona intestinalis]|eukprot:XP_002120723.3 uncharacterized protein LOC100187023 [Ciona intestinalis]
MYSHKAEHWNASSSTNYEALDTMQSHIDLDIPSYYPPEYNDQWQTTNGNHPSVRQRSYGAAYQVPNNTFTQIYPAKPRYIANQMNQNLPLYMVSVNGIQSTKNAHVHDDSFTATSKSHTDLEAAIKHCKQIEADKAGQYETFPVENPLFTHQYPHVTKDNGVSSPEEMFIIKNKPIIYQLREQVQSLKQEMGELRGKTFNFKKEISQMFQQLLQLNQLINRRSYIQRDDVMYRETMVTKQTLNTACATKLKDNDTDCEKQNIQFVNSLNDNQCGDEKMKEEGASRLESLVEDEIPLNVGSSKVTCKEEVERGGVFTSSAGTKYMCNGTGRTVALLADRKKKITILNRNDNLRILPILSESNAALHTSECSIDSGYQDSSMTSPRDRREQTSLVVTPASPLCESLIEENETVTYISQRIDDSTTNTETLSRDDCFAMEDRGKSSKTEVVFEANSSLQPSGQTYLNTTCINLRPVTVDSKPKPRAPRKIVKSNDIEVRPVPKHRTVFVKIDEHPVSTYDVTTTRKKQVTEYSQSVFCNDGGLDTQNNSPQCQKADETLDTSVSSSEGMSTNSPCVQRRVKLGVSAISKPCGNLALQERISIKEGKSRKAAQAKQELRQKFAAVFEKSNIESGAMEPKVAENEASIVRRRSMRMMTEFQIFDFNEIVSNPDSEKKISNDVISQLHYSNVSLDTSIGDLSANKTDQLQQNANHARVHSPTLRSMTPLQQTLCSLTPPPVTLPSTEAKCPSVSGSLASLMCEVHPIPQPSPQRAQSVFNALVLRPKPAFPGVSCDAATNNSPIPSLGGQLITPSGRSAFTPVAPSPHMLTQPAPLKNIEISTGPTNQPLIDDTKRRVSLPTSIVSNKRNELPHTRSRDDLVHSSPTEHNVFFHRGYSLRVPKKGVVQTPTRLGKPPITSEPTGNVADMPQQTSETIKSPSVAKHNSIKVVRQEIEARQSTVAQKKSIRKKKSVTNTPMSTKPKAVERSQPIQQSIHQSKQLTSKKAPQHHVTRAKEDKHVYETVKKHPEPAAEKRELQRQQVDANSRFMRPQDRAAKSGGKKSTVALLRASIMGRKANITNEKKCQESSEAISSNATKQKSFVTEVKSNASNSFKKSREETNKRAGMMKKSSRQFAGKQQVTGKVTTRVNQCESKRMDADSEVMDKFLDAAVASHIVRSPLQKLRSSFRTPRNKNKLMQMSRVKDDMEISKYGPLGVVNGKLVNRQEQFTYV